MMTGKIEALGLDRLSRAERLILAHELWEGTVDAEGPLLGEAHHADLERRLQAFADDPQAGEPWEVVRKRLFGG